ncbi:MAG: hypothetical protein QNK05_14755 [Myxococcota bacterium]|nr:hypothetical protein [Myxococcota bacterium]
MDTPLRKLLGLGSMAIAFIAVADGLAMLLPGPSSTLGGSALVILGMAWLVVGVRWMLTPGGRPFAPVLVSRFGLFVLPVLCLPVALVWYVATPHALSIWFGVAWLVTWAACLVLSASLPCPRCGQPFGRSGARLQGRSSTCPHCGADPRGEPSPQA